jgi:hypothetical protein
VKPAQLFSRHKIYRWLPGVLISFVALFAVFRMVRWEDLKLSLSTIRLLNVFIVIAITLVALVARALAWQVLLAWKAGFRRSFFLINLGYFLNNILPLRAGEIGRAVFMGQASGLGTFHVLSTILIERAFDLAIAAGLLLATLPLVLGMAWARPVAVVTMILVLLGLFALYLIARNGPRVHARISGLGTRFRLVHKWIVPSLDSLVDGLGALTRPGQFLLSVLLIVTSWGLWVCMYYTILWSLSPHLPLYWAGFTIGVLAMGIAIPAAPGGLGVYEASLVGALALFGISPSSSLAIALLMRFLQFGITGIFGFYELARSHNSIHSLIAQIKT